MKKWMKITGLLLSTLPVAVFAGDYTYTTNGGTITITRYTGLGGIVDVPSTINGLLVTRIGDGAFYGRPGPGPTSVTIPDSVTSIGSTAFEECDHLNNIQIGNGVTNIGQYAFANCDVLGSVWIGDSIKNIEDYAFYNCPELTGMHFKGNAPGFSIYIFYETPYVTVYYLTGTTGWGATFGGRPTVRQNPLYLLSITNGTGGGSYTNQQRVTIKANAQVGYSFDQWIGDTQYVASVTSSTTTVIIPLSAVTLTATYKKIYYKLIVSGGDGSGSYFYHQQVTINASNAPSGQVFMWSGDTQYVASVTSSTTTVTMPTNDVTLTATYKDAYILTVIDGSSSGLYAEYQQVTITAAPLAGQVFYRWSGTTQHIASVTSSPTILTMPASNIAVAATYESTNASDFKYTIDGGCATITGYTGSASSVKIASYIVGAPVTSIGWGAFSYRTNLTGVYIPSSVTNIGGWAFSQCYQLTSISIPDRVTSIGDQAFSSCTNLTSVTIGNSVTSIGIWAFNNCKKLTSVTIPDSVTSLGNYAFYSCSKLTDITIPDSVINLGDYTFNLCSSLTNVTIGSNVTNIGDYAFSQCDNLTSVTIPNSVTRVGNRTFYQCRKLTNITIPNSVVNIGGYAFSSCSNLTSVTIGSKVTDIGSYALSSCTNLIQVYFKGNAPSVGSSMFTNANRAIVYYRPGTTGWSETFAGRPTVLWNPHVQTTDTSFGVQANCFGFNIAGDSNIAVVVEACTNLTSGVWLPVKTNTLTGGSVYFNDPQWSNYPGRFYRLSMP